MRNKNVNSPESIAAKDSDDELFLTKLRASTMPAHKKLESLPLSSLLISPDITLQEYSLYLSLMSGIVTDIEEHIFPLVSTTITDTERRKKSALIAADLQYLSAIPSGKRPLQDAGHPHTIPFAMGIMYVIEGSTLGGRVIIKNIEKTLGLNEQAGGKYFSGYGSETGPLWKSFLNNFSAYGADAAIQDEIIAGADFAFETIHNQLQQNTR